MSKEAKIGAILIVLLAALFIFAPSSRTRSGVFSNNYRLVFHETPGLEPNASVKIAGVDIGYVKNIDFCTKAEKEQFGDDANVVVSIATDFSAKIPEDSAANVLSESTSLVWLEITPGISKIMLKEDATVRLQSSPSSGLSMSALGQSPLKKINDQIASLKDEMKAKNLTLAIKDMAANSRFYSNELRLVSKDAHGKLEKLSETVDEEEKALHQQLERVNTQLTETGHILTENTKQFKEKSITINNKIQNLDDKLYKLGNLAASESERFKALSASVETKTKKTCNPELIAKLHKASRKLKDYAQIAEDLHYMTQEPSTQQAIKDMVGKYRGQAESIDNLVRKLGGLPSAQEEASSTPTPLPME